MLFAQNLFNLIARGLFNCFVCVFLNTINKLILVVRIYLAILMKMSNILIKIAR